MKNTSVARESVKPIGIVYRRLYSGQKFHDLLVEAGVPLSKFDAEKDNITTLYLTAKKYLAKEAIDRLLDQSAKKMFKDNKIWKFLNKNFGMDLVIPFVTGYYTTKAIKGNLVTTVGKKIVADQLGGTTTTPVTAIAIGVGAVAAAAGDTTLGSESTTGGAARGAATVTNTTTTTTGDTEQWVKTFTFSATFAITEEGLLNNNASGGLLLARQVFSAVNVVSGDSLQITHQVKAA